MLQSQFVETNRIKHWSDEGYYIRQIETDILYIDAVDNLPCKYTYEETTEPIPLAIDEEQ